MAAVLESVVGPWGATFISIGVIISVQGAYLAWTLINAEALYTRHDRRNAQVPCQEQQEPHADRRIDHDERSGSGVATQRAGRARRTGLHACTGHGPLFGSISLRCRIRPQAHHHQGDLRGADESERRRQQIIAAVAVVYSIFLLYAAGPKYLLVACIVYAPGTLLYIWARREQGMRVFQPAEAVICVALIVAAIVGIVLISTGYLAL